VTIQDLKLSTERAIAGACLGFDCFVLASGYVSERSFLDPVCRATFLFSKVCFAAGKNTDVREWKDYLTLNGLKVSHSQMMKLLSGAVNCRIPAECLLLIELNLRLMAVAILKKNREEVLIPLAPIEADLLNTGNDVFETLVAAVNYLADRGLKDLAMEMSELLGGANGVAERIKKRERAEMLVRQLVRISDQNPEVLKPFKNTLIEITNVAST
jgi:hypothetical protein